MQCRLPRMQISLPKRINFVNYIRSSGTQYIDTGFKPNQNTKVEIKMQSSNQNGDSVWIFGCQTSWSTNGFAVSTHTAEFGNSNATTGVNFYDGNDHTIIFDKGVLKKDGSTIWTGSGTFQTIYNMYISGINAAGTGISLIGKIYYAKIWDNDTLIRDYLPCLDKDGIACLYDQVNKEYYYNAGSGEFIAGEAA